MGKIAVILLNMGGPDSLKAVKPFLFNLFSDKNMIRLPNPLRNFVAKKISGGREEEAKHIYSKIGGKSPILEITRRQADDLAKMLNQLSEKENTNHQSLITNHQFRTFISMRYWHPFSHETAEEVKCYDPEMIVLLPLYPQFSTTTSKSSIEDWMNSAKNAGIKTEHKVICCYPTEDDFIAAHAAIINNQLSVVGEKNNIKNIRILFSAHGLPEKIVKGGDPYQWQVEQTVKAVMDRLGNEISGFRFQVSGNDDLNHQLPITNYDYSICYQSRVGPLKWIGPSIEEEINRAGDDKVDVVVVPIAFVSEHSETLVELDINYKNLAESLGIKYYRVPALNINELYIKSLAGLCIKALSDKKICLSHTGEKICPKEFGGCMMAKMA